MLLPVIFLSLVDSFFLAPGSSEEEEVEGSGGFSLEDEEVEGIAVDDVEVGGGAGVLKSWTDPPAGSAKGSGGWEVEVRGVSVTRVETELRVGERDGEGETLFSLLSLASASERVGRAARYGIGTSPNAACSQLKRPSRGIPLSKSKFLEGTRVVVQEGYISCNSPLASCLVLGFLQFFPNKT